MPYISITGMFKLWKNSSVSFIIGAADARKYRQRSRPRAWRTELNTSQFANVQPYGKLPLNTHTQNASDYCITVSTMLAGHQAEHMTFTIPAPQISTGFPLHSQWWSMIWQALTVNIDRYTSAGKMYVVLLWYWPLTRDVRILPFCTRRILLRIGQCAQKWPLCAELTKQHRKCKILQILFSNIALSFALTCQQKAFWCKSNKIFSHSVH